MRVSDGGRGGTKRYRGALDSHLSDIRKYKLLTPSGEFRLASATQRGEADARNELVQANLRLVVKIAKTYRVPGMDLDELIAEGELGLIEAANRFDPSRGVRFVAYAPYWIRKYVLLAVGRHKRQTTSPAEPDVMEGAGAAESAAGWSRSTISSTDQTIADSRIRSRPRRRPAPRTSRSRSSSLRRCARCCRSLRLGTGRSSPRITASTKSRRRACRRSERRSG